MFVYRLPFTSVHLYNVLVQLGFNFVLVRTLGWPALAYLIVSSFLAGSLHPCAGHFIAEHYVFARSQQSPASVRATAPALDPAVPLPETFSYYGPLNVLTYNVGLHNEHHDFPAIPWSRLPALHQLAREFYAPLPHHTSWVGVLWQFVWDREVGMWCRVKRKEGGRKVGAGAWRTEDLGANEGRSVAGVR